jgi:hypothetical protein
MSKHNSPRTTYAQAAAGYDSAFSNELMKRITTVIAETSKLTAGEIVRIMPTALRNKLLDLALKTLSPWRLMEELERRIPSCKPKTIATLQFAKSRMKVEGLEP